MTVNRTYKEADVEVLRKYINNYFASSENKKKYLIIKCINLDDKIGILKALVEIGAVMWNGVPASNYPSVLTDNTKMYIYLHYSHCVNLINEFSHSLLGGFESCYTVSNNFVKN